MRKKELQQHYSQWGRLRKSDWEKEKRVQREEAKREREQEEKNRRSNEKTSIERKSFWRKTDTERKRKRESAKERQIGSNLKQERDRQSK